MGNFSRDADSGPRRKRRKRKRGKRGAVSQRRGRDKSVEGKERQLRDRKERPGDRKGFQRSRKRRPERRQRREGGDRTAKRDFGRDRAGGDRGPDRQKLGGIRDEINAIKQRREEFSQRRPEQVAEGRGMDPGRLQDFQEGGKYQQPAPMPAPAPEVQPQPYKIGPDGRVGDGGLGTFPGQAPGHGGGDPNAGQVIINQDQVGAYDAAPIYGPAPAQPQPAPDQSQIGVGYTPPGAPGPTVEPGVPTDAYGQPAKPMPAPSGPYQPAPAPMPMPQPQVNPRAAGMDRMAQRPQEEYRRA